MCGRILCSVCFLYLFMSFLKCIVCQHVLEVDQSSFMWSVTKGLLLHNNSPNIGIQKLAAAQVFTRNTRGQFVCGETKQRAAGGCMPVLKHKLRIFNPKRAAGKFKLR